MEKDGNITFSIKKKNDSNKIIIIKINIDNPNDFKIIRSLYIDNNQKEEKEVKDEKEVKEEKDEESKINQKSNLSTPFIIIIFVLMIFIIVGFIFYKVYKKNKNKNLSVDNIGPLGKDGDLNEEINNITHEEKEREIRKNNDNNNIEIANFSKKGEIHKKNMEDDNDNDPSIPPINPSFK